MPTVAQKIRNERYNQIHKKITEQNSKMFYANMKVLHDQAVRQIRKEGALSALSNGSHDNSVLRMRDNLYTATHATMKRVFEYIFSDTTEFVLKNIYNSEITEGYKSHANPQLQKNLKELTQEYAEKYSNWFFRDIICEVEDIKTSSGQLEERIRKALEYFGANDLKRISSLAAVVATAKTFSIAQDYFKGGSWQ